MTSRYQHIWQSWVERLQQLGLHTLTATVLEGSGPLNILGAQLVYLGQPVLNGLVPNESVQALAELLEDPGDLARFLQALRGETR